MPLTEKESFEQLFSDLYKNRFATRELAFYLWELVRYEIQDDRFFVWANPLKAASSMDRGEPGIHEMRLKEIRERAPIRLGCVFRMFDTSTLMPRKRVQGYGLNFWFDKELVEKLSRLTDEDLDNGVHSQLLSEFDERAESDESNHRP